MRLSLPLITACSAWLFAAPLLADSALTISDRFDVGKDVYVRALAVDNNKQQLWVGTSGGALQVDLASGKLLATHNRTSGLANEYVFAIHAAHDGSIWFGTNGGGASRLKNGHWRTWFPMHGLADYWVYSFTETHNGDLWLGTWNGVNRMSARDGTLHTYRKELVNEWVYGATSDSKDQVWLATEGGISMYDGQQWQQWTHADGVGAANQTQLPLSSNSGLGTRSRHNLSVLNQGQATYNPGYVFCVLADQRDDSIWAGTWGGGLAHYQNGQWQNLTTADGLPGAIVFSLAQTDDGALWLGTDQGVAVLQDGQWTRFGLQDGLPASSVYALTAQHNAVWAGMRKAVVRLQRQPDIKQ